VSGLRPALLLAALCVAAPAFADTEIEDLDAANFSFGAMAIGQAKDVNYARAEGLGLVPTSPLDAYLNGVLQKLLAGSPVRGVPARVYVRASGDWAAKSTADANVYVALGALLRLDDEDEVAALLAHEASHVILGHPNTDVVASLQGRVVQLTALAADAQDMLAASGVKVGKGVGGTARADEQTQALLLNTMLVSPAWTREQERDADRLGVDLLVKAGYSPRAMASLLRKQQQFESERRADPELSLLDQKVVGIDLQETASGHAQDAARKVGGAVGGGALGDLADAAIGKAFEWGAKKTNEAQRSHPKTEERLADVEEYVSDEYEDEAGRTVQVQAWETAKEQDGTVDVLENYIAAIEAKGKLADGDVAGARRLAKTALSGPTKTDAYPNYVQAAIELEGGGGAKLRVAAYERAMERREPAGAIYSGTRAPCLESGKQAEAVEVIEGAYARLQQPPGLTIPLIRTYRLAGRQADADRVALQCGARWPRMQQVCLDEAKGKTPAKAG